MEKLQVKRIAFIVPEFPVVSLTFIINQIADLNDRGIKVDIYALRGGDESHVSKRYFEYNMCDSIVRIGVPKSKILRVTGAIRISLYMLFRHPRILFRCVHVREHGLAVRSLNTLFWVRPFIGKDFDIVHCHMGTVATKYLTIRKILNHTQKFVTTFYGYDVSHTPKEKGMDCYHSLAKECDKFLVMSNNMKERTLPLGIPEDKIEVHPISIDVESYHFKERKYTEGEKIQVTSVGRFVEKKGFDDLLRAIAIVKEKSSQSFVCNIVGDGELKDELYALAAELDINDVVDFKGFMKLEDVFKLYEDSHLYVQPSKTAGDGDME